MKLTNSEDPLVLIDEIDKIGSSSQLGEDDPGSDILELLHPEHCSPKNGLSICENWSNLTIRSIYQKIPPENVSIAEIQDKETEKNLSVTKTESK